VHQAIIGFRAAGAVFSAPSPETICARDNRLLIATDRPSARPVRGFVQNPERHSASAGAAAAL